MPGDLYLVRHGDTTLNDKGVFRSHLNPPLNASGREDADRLAYYFASHEVADLRSSPLQRAMQTARAIGRQAGVSVQEDARWRPWHLGDWAGQVSAPLVPKMLAAIKTDEAPPGGEPFSAFQRRVSAALSYAQNLAHRSDGDVVVVTHVRNIRLVLDILKHPHPLPDEMHNVAAKDDPVEPGGVMRLDRRPDGRWTSHTVALPTQEHAMARGFGGGT